MRFAEDFRSTLATMQQLSHRGWGSISHSYANSDLNLLQNGRR